MFKMFREVDLILKMQTQHRISRTCFSLFFLDMTKHTFEHSMNFYYCFFIRGLDGKQILLIVCLILQ